MKKQKISKNKMAMLLKTSRTQVDRLLDPKNDITLSSLQGQRRWWAPGFNRAGLTGLSREQLYRSFSEKRNPTLKTTLAVMKALGIELTAKAQRAA